MSTETEILCTIEPGLWKPVFDRDLGYWVPAYGPWKFAILEPVIER